MEPVAAPGAPSMALRASTEMHLLPNAADAARVRRAVRDVLGSWGIDASVTDDAVLVADELYSNALVHACTGEDDRMTLTLALNGLALTVAVTDTDPRLPAARSSGDAEESGRGLQLIQALSVEWGTERRTDGKRVWALLPALPTARGSAAS